MANCINWTKMLRGNDDAIESSLQRASVQISMVSASGTLVKRLKMSKEQRKTKEKNVNFLTSFTKMKELDAQLEERFWRTG